MLRHVIDDGLNGSDYLKFHSIYTAQKNNAWLFIESLPKDQFYKYFHNYCKKSEVLFYLNSEEEIIGHCRLIKKSGSHDHVVEIGAVAIDPKYHGLGYGKKMLAEIKEWVEKNKSTKYNYANVCRIELSYEADNPIAMIGKGEFYLKCGFETEGYLDDWYQREETPDYKNFDFPNPTREIFANYMTNFGKEVLIKKEQNQTAFNSIQNNEESKNYKFRLAEELDIPILITLYDWKFSDYSHLEKNNRKNELLQQIKKNGIFVVVNDVEEIIAACQIEPQEGRIKQDAIISNVVSNHNYSGLQFLFNSIIEYHLENRLHSNIRRLELNIPAGDSLATEVMKQNGFENTGIQKIKFKDNENNFWDENIFQYTLFTLEDAITYFKNRRLAENNLTEKNKSFFISLPEYFMTIIDENLKELAEMTLSYPQQHAIYKLIRALCSHDYIPIESRLTYCQNLKNLVEVKDIDAFQKLANLCINYLSNRLMQPIAINSNLLLKESKNINTLVNSALIKDDPLEATAKLT